VAATLAVAVTLAVEMAAATTVEADPLVEPAILPFNYRWAAMVPEIRALYQTGGLVKP